MAYGVSSVTERFELTADQTVNNGVTFRWDRVMVANSTANAAVVNFVRFDDGVTVFATVVCEPYDTVTHEISGVADHGMILKAVSAGVYVTIMRSSGPC